MYRYCYTQIKRCILENIKHMILLSTIICIYQNQTRIKYMQFLQIRLWRELVRTIIINNSYGLIISNITWFEISIDIVYIFTQSQTPEGVQIRTRAAYTLWLEQNTHTKGPYASTSRFVLVFLVCAFITINRAIILRLKYEKNDVKIVS